MKRSTCIAPKGAACLAILVLSMFAHSGLQANTVVTPAKRLEALAKAKDLLIEKQLNGPLKNPFNPEGFGEGQQVNPPGGTTTTPALPVGPRSARDLLQAIGASLKPSGSMVLGGEPVLLFGQKRVKAGGLLTITFEGNEYALEIVSINQPNFTLRLNREEFTRPIK
ncbi:MAG: hypothetical protein QG602_1506 [Verrucomicrobiota bacterium]|nr:hypothetical protein [Verrucomicrobiota bacterium]